MKNNRFFLILSILFFFTHANSQTLLDVQGDTKILGKLSIINTVFDSSIFIGANAGVNVNESSTNLFIGTNAGYSTIDGASNTFVGNNSGKSNIDGHGNVFIGQEAGYSNNGVFNTFLGARAGFLNNDLYNTFIGAGAGADGKTGSQNTFMGYGAGTANQAAGNTFVGVNAGNSNNSGDANVFIGLATGENNSTGSQNTFVGNQAGQNNAGNDNVFIGMFTGLYNRQGADNTFVGTSAGENSETGSQNTFVGKKAGISNQGDGNTAFGYNAIAALTDNGSINNAFAFGTQSIMTASHSGTLGNIATQKIGGYVNWGTASDKRMKNKIREDVKGLDFILKLRPVSFQINTVKLDNVLRKKIEKHATNRNKIYTQKEQTKLKLAEQKYNSSLKEKAEIRYTGFIAQEVEKVLEESNFEFSGLVKPSNSKDHYSLRYAEFVVPLVKGVQEQQQIIERQQQQINELKEKTKEMEKVKSEVQELKSLVEKLLADKKADIKENSYILPLEQKAMLSQNQPNPFNQSTVVEFFIPHNVRSAKIRVTSVDGKVLSTIKIQETGKGQVTIKTNTFSAGIYYYSLLLDEQTIETKRMVLTR